MNIIIVSQLFYPDNFRINDITAELVRQGNNVRVITGLPDCATSKIPKEYKWFKNRKQKIFGADIRRVRNVARHKGVFFRALNYCSFALNACVYALFCDVSGVDVIYAYQTSPILQVLPAIVLKHRTKKKLVLYCCDLWPESLKAWNVKENSIFFKFILKVCKKIYAAADTVAITSTPFREYLTKVCGAKNEKITYLPQHCDDLYKDICGKWVENNCIDFVFAGNIGSVQNIDCIIRAAKLLPQDKNFKVHIIGNGSELDNCKMLVQELDIADKVIFHGRYPLEKMRDFYMTADCFLLTLRGGDFIGQTLPSKAQAYLCAGRPIAAAIDGAAREMIKEADCGECVAAGDYKALSGIMNLIMDNFELYKQKGLNGRRYYEKNYTMEIFIDKLTDLLNA